MDQFSLLRLIIEITDRGSLAGAARALSISPASATLGLQRLEDQAGVRLVTRSTRRLLLTPEGEHFVQDARRIVGDLAEAFEQVSDRGALRGPIRLTATHDLGRSQLVPLIHAFMQEHPGVRVLLSLSDGVSDLVKGRFDCALRICGPLDDTREGTRLLRRGHRRVCAAPAYWQAHGRPEHPRDLAGHNCLHVSGPEWSENSWAFIEQGRPFHVRVSGDRGADDGGAIRAWALAGAGVLFNASFDVEADIAEGRLEPVLDRYTRAQEVNLYAMMMRSGSGSRRVVALVDYLDAHLPAGEAPRQPA